VREHRSAYDLVVVDSTDPVGPAEGLFSATFYRDVFQALTEEGLFIAQTGSPFFNRELIPRIFKDIAGIFPVTRLYHACVPTYPGGMWTFTLGSKKYDPLRVEWEKLPGLKTRYYSPAVHQNAFLLPPFVAELIGR
jgi:spermidine synthase